MQNSYRWNRLAQLLICWHSKTNLSVHGSQLQICDFFYFFAIFSIFFLIFSIFWFFRFFDVSIFRCFDFSRVKKICTTDKFVTEIRYHIIYVFFEIFLRDNFLLKVPVFFQKTYRRAFSITGYFGSVETEVVFELVQDLKYSEWHVN